MKLRILLVMLLLAAMMAAVVVFASPYAPVVLPAPENIEELWEIEDTREESETPLVTALTNHGVPLAYDAQANRFYCTLGMDNGESWPQLHLIAPQAEGVTLVFSDDYTYDWCADAIRDGYAYQVMAYNDTHFSYFEIVFTGLPQVQITTNGQEFTTEDSPVHVVVSAYGEETLDSTARIHLRGASTLLFDKQSYKVEFTREKDGKAKKIEREVPGFGAADDVALLPCWHDDIKMRDKLSWDLWAELAADDEPFGARKTEYVEVFKDNEYIGLFVMIEPVDVREELRLAGDDSLLTDSVYRTAALNFSRDREYYKHPHRGNAGYELYYAPADMDSFEEKFAGLEPYIELTKIEDDAEFAQRAQEIIDVDSMLRHVLLMQGGAIADNFFNNMYIWAHPERDGGMTYRFSLWDLDMSWGFEKDEIGEEYERWLYFPVADRMLNLDVGGIRRKAYDMWQAMRQTVFSEEKLEERIEQYTMEIGESGALMRDAERWGTEMYYPDGYELINFAGIRWPLIDEAMEMLVNTDGPLDFLSASHYEQKAGDIF